MQDNSFYDYLVIHSSGWGELGGWGGCSGGWSAVDLPLLMERSKAWTGVWGGGLERRGKEGRAVAQDCRTLMNDHPIQACHPTRRVSALAEMDRRGGNLSCSEHGGSGHRHLKEHLGDCWAGWTERRLPIKQLNGFCLSYLKGFKCRNYYGTSKMFWIFCLILPFLKVLNGKSYWWNLVLLTI